MQRLPVPSIASRQVVFITCDWTNRDKMVITVMCKTAAFSPPSGVLMKAASQTMPFDFRLALHSRMWYHVPKNPRGAMLAFAGQEGVFLQW